MAGRPNGVWPGRHRHERRGVATVEPTLLLPMLAFILVASTDFARAFHDFVTITDCARNGALYAAQNASDSPATYGQGISSAATADSSGLTGAPTVSHSGGSVGAGNDYVDVTVSSPCQTINPCPGIPDRFTLNRTIRMRVQPSTYRMQ